MAREKVLRRWDWKCHKCKQFGHVMAVRFVPAKEQATLDHNQAGLCMTPYIGLTITKPEAPPDPINDALATRLIPFDRPELTDAQKEAEGVRAEFAASLQRFLDMQVGPSLGKGDVLHRCKHLIDGGIAAFDVFTSAKDKALMLKSLQPLLRLHAEINGHVGPRINVTDGESVSMIRADRQRLMLQNPQFREMVERLETYAATSDITVLDAEFVDVGGDVGRDDPGRVRDAGVPGSVEDDAAPGDPES